MGLTYSGLFRCGFRLIENPFSEYVPVSGGMVLEWQGTLWDFEMGGEVEKVITAFKTKEWIVLDGGSVVINPSFADLLTWYDFLKYRPELNFVYIKETKFGYKIGKTTDIDKRNIFGIQVPFEVKTKCVMVTDDHDGLELFLHEKLKLHRIAGEWFDLDRYRMDLLSAFNRGQDSFKRSLANL